MTWDNINPFVFAAVSILPWGFFLFLLHPGSKKRKILLTILALLLGYLSTVIILYLHPLLWPEVGTRPKRMTILTQTAHIAFIQAGIMEETFKIIFILLLAFVFAYSWKKSEFGKDVVLIAGFVALGFSLFENFQYISKQPATARLEIFIGRTIHSSNIHLLINLCFGLFLLKSNGKTFREKLIIVSYAFFLAIAQHGVVDFFLLPSSRFGTWLATALFVGIWVWVVRDMRSLVYNVNPVTR